MNKKVLVFCTAILLVGAGGYFWMNKTFLKTQEVKVEKVLSRDINETILARGTVIPGEIVPIYIEAPVLIERLLIKDGEEVEVGAELLVFSQKSRLENERELRVNELDIKDIKLRLNNLASGAMKLELDNRKLEIKRLEENINGYLRKLPVLSAESKSLKEKASAYIMLHSKDGVTSTEKNIAVTEAGKKETELEDLKVQLELERQRYNLMVISYDNLVKQLNAEELKLKSDLEKLELGREQLEKRQQQLSETLKSPVAGIVTALDVIEGSNALAGQRLLSISPLGSSIVRIELPMIQSSSIKKGQKAEIISRENYSETKKVKGTVEKISNLAKQIGKERVIEIYIAPEEKNNLKPGYFTEVKLFDNKKNEVPIISSFSVLEENEKSFVYVVENGTVKKKIIEKGIMNGGKVQVLDLPLGTEVVINPFKVKEGDRVKVVN